MRIAYFIFCFFLASQALAFEEFPSQVYQKCMDETEGVTMEMNECVGRESERVIQIYDKVYQEFLEKSATKEKFEATEKAWKQFVENTADYAAGFYKGGTMENLVYTDFMLQERSRRLTLLSRFDSLGTIKGPEVSLERLRNEILPARITKNSQAMADELDEDQQKEQQILFEASQNSWLKYIELTAAYIKEQKGDKAAENWLISEYQARADFVMPGAK